MLPPVDSPPAVTSVLDLQHEEYPAFFSRAELRYRRVVYGWTVKRSRLVITISNHAASTLVHRLGVPSGRIRPIHLGIDHERFTPGRGATRGLPPLPGARLAAQEPRAAVRGAPRSCPDQAARPDRLRRPRPRGRRVARPRLAGGARLALPRAAALVFPSLYEGFGQPSSRRWPAAAPSRARTPPRCRRSCGDAARLFDPRDPAAIAAAVDDVLAAPEEWVAKGLARAASSRGTRARGRTTRSTAS